MAANSNLCFLIKVSKESESNGMNAYNLARVFCPSLMRNTADQGAVDNFTSRDRADIDHQTRVVELLVLHATAIFGPAESVLPKDYSLRYNARSKDCRKNISYTQSLTFTFASIRNSENCCCKQCK